MTFERVGRKMASHGTPSDEQSSPAISTLRTTTGVEHLGERIIDAGMVEGAAHPMGRPLRASCRII